MEHKEQMTDFLAFLQESVSPFHGVEAGIRRLKKAGFEKLDLNQPWKIREGQGYYLDICGSTLFAIRKNGPLKDGEGFRMAGAHTDWPSFRIKPNADMRSNQYHKLNIECYGGPILSTWLDRPLSIAGRVVLKGEDIFHPETRLVDFRRPVLTIPNLCIHQNRKVNEGVELKKQTDMIPVFDYIKKELEEKSFLDYLALELDTEKDAILDYDLSIYNAEAPAYVGIAQDMISAPRLDNLTSCYAAIFGMMEGKRDHGIDVLYLTDHEEIGSRSVQGADSSMLSMLLERFAAACRIDREAFLRMLPESYLLSADAAHGVHPNKPQTTDPTNQVGLGDGVVIKLSYCQKYATNTQVTGITTALCQKNGIPYTRFVNHADSAGGGTIGAITSTHLPIKISDVGVPMLAMHSARELIAVSSQLAMNALMKALFS